MKKERPNRDFDEKHPAKSLLEVLAELQPIKEEFPSIPDPPPEPFDL